MDPNTWVETLYTYGPYAALALFALYIAPRQTKTFLECQEQELAKLSFCGAVAGLSWLIVLALVWFLIVSWPPKKVFTGELGAHGPNVSFIAGSDDLYIGSKTFGRNFDRIAWDYVIVSDQSADGDDTFRFTYVWGDGDYEYRDFEITRAELADGPVSFKPDEDDPKRLERAQAGNGSDKATARRGTGSRGPGDMSWPGIRSAHAQERIPAAVVDALNSDDAKIRSLARRQLRQVDDDALRSLLRDPSQPERVREQLARELAARANR